ncbi:PTS system trehalose-specific EIIBC component [Aerococcaceae bacterium DSM 111020]|nr:PTS system trehalose-specific EIIBC component [Aerococcaceae bacterium DSM 111020]
MSFEKDAKELLRLIGGDENISAVTHCATRMRFALSDPKQADVDAIEALDSVRGTFTQAGQFQVIIGNNVSDFYKEFQKYSNVSESNKDAVKEQARGNQSWFQSALSFLADVFTPIIPAFIVGGLILGFRNILEGIGFSALGQAVVDGVAQVNADGTPIYNTIVNVSPFWSGVNDFLWLPGEAIFHFLPVGITWSVTRRMGTTQILGIILGITLVSPQLLNAYGAPDAILAGEVPQWDFGAFQVDKIGYQAQVLPAIFAGLTLGWFEQFWRKRVPEYLSMILVPFLALVPAIILAHTVLGPIGWKIGTWIGEAVYAGLTSSLNWLFGAFFGAIYAPLVITGLHHMTNAVDAQLIADFQGTQLWPMIALSNIAQASAVLGYWWLTRQNERENQITIPSTISAYLGVTEPALFGVTLKYVYPMVAAMIGSGLAGMYSVFTGVTSNSIGVGGLPGILVIQPEHMINFAFAMAIAIIVPFVLTIVFRKSGFLVKEDQVSTSAAVDQSIGKEPSVTNETVVDNDIQETEVNTNIEKTGTTESTILYSSKDSTADKSTEVESGIAQTTSVNQPEEASNEVTKSNEDKFVSVADGEVVSVEEVSDPVFSSKAMGDGFAVEPTNGQVVSPVSGKITNIFPTKHAIGIETDSGIEILVHMGLDTVELKGEGFEVLVSEGDLVDYGTPIAQMDLDSISAAGKELSIVVVFVSGDKIADYGLDFTGSAEAGHEIGHYTAG